ncbi:MAG TPA: hypothetical protein VF072_05145 [Thermoleophilaceae bacterium]
MAGGRTVAYYDKPDCQAPASAFVMIARSLTVYFQLGLGFMSQPHPWDPADQSIIGSETQDYPGLTIKREWTLSRNGIAP